MASTKARRGRYQAFLSFRGDDTRDNFVSHLYKRMTDKGIYTFKDDRILEIGRSIPLELKEAIRDSELHVVVLSENYASSSWCLDELVDIVDQGTRGKRNGAVVPVFYKVDPSDVRKQRGSFAKAFESHEGNFEVEKVKRWRECLREVANMCGWDSRKRDEADFISDIVRDILDKVNCAASIDTSDFVGMSSHVEQLLRLLSVDSVGVWMVGIWGMGGIGKSTIARVVYDRIYNKYVGSCYIKNIGTEFKKHGATYLRGKLLSSILGETDLTKWPLDKDSNIIKERLCRIQVLIVLDDVDELEQLQVLAKDTSWFGSGSRIIITTRERQLLDSHGVKSVYETKPLETDMALKLFSRFAFKQNQPPDDYLVLSHGLVSITGCVPLALKVLGSSLCNRNIFEWQRELDKLRRIPNWDVLKVLKVSYDGLDDMEKDVFLDIACFFNGMNKDKVRNILDGCGFFSERAFDLLMDKSLLSILDNNLYMHELLRQLGQEIVRRECKELGQRTRWWDPDDIYHCLTKNMGTEKTEGIFLDMSESKEMHLESKAFEKMTSLRLLKFHCSERIEHACNVKLLGASLHSLSNRLRYIHWDAFPAKELPFDFCAEFLVELHLPYSNVELLWEGKQHPANLKLVDANHSDLTRLPDLSDAQALESLNLQNCKRLADVASIEYLSKLEFLNLSGCTALVTIPSMEELKFLTTVDLAYCSNLRKLHQLSRSTKYMYLAGTAIEELPPSIEFLSGLIVLDLRDCRRLQNLQGCSKLKSLRNLDVAGSPNLLEFPMQNQYGEPETTCLEHPSLYMPDRNFDYLSDGTLTCDEQHYKEQQNDSISFLQCSNLLSETANILTASEESEEEKNEKNNEWGQTELETEEEKKRKYLKNEPLERMFPASVAIEVAKAVSSSAPQSSMQSILEAFEGLQVMLDQGPQDVGQTIETLQILKQLAGDRISPEEKARLSSIEKKITLLVGRVLAKNYAKKEIESKIQTCNQQSEKYKNLSAAMEKADQDMKSVTSEIDGLRSRIADLEEQSASSDKRKGEVNQRRNSLTTELPRLYAELKNLRDAGLKVLEMMVEESEIAARQSWKELEALHEMVSSAAAAICLSAPDPDDDLLDDPSAGCYPARISPFVIIALYEMVDDPEIDQVVSWNDDGSTFIIWQPSVFRNYFPEFRSLDLDQVLRRLHRPYGFQKIGKRWEFYNKGFRKGRVRIARAFPRKSQSKESSVGRSSGSPLHINDGWRTLDDGYLWEKVHNMETLVVGNMSHYRCLSHPFCPVYKREDRDLDGNIAEIIYLNCHYHPKPRSSFKMPFSAWMKDEDKKRTRGKQKLVLELWDLHDDGAKREAMKSVSAISGIDSIAIDMEGKKLTVVGEVDPVEVVSKLRKSGWQTDMVALWPAKEQTEKDKKKDEKKEGGYAEPFYPYMAYDPYLRYDMDNFRPTLFPAPIPTPNADGSQTGTPPGIIPRPDYFIMIVVIVGLRFFGISLAIVAALLTVLAVTFLYDREISSTKRTLPERSQSYTSGFSSVEHREIKTAAAGDEKKTTRVDLATEASEAGNDIHDRNQQPVAVESIEARKLQIPTVRRLQEEMVCEFMKPKCVQALGNVGKLLTPWDVGHALRYIEEVQDILLHMSRITKIDFNDDALTSILGFEMLKVHNSYRVAASKSLPNILRAECFVEFHLPYYNFRILWSGKPAVGNLRLINLKNSSKLISLPDLSEAGKIVHLKLRGCIKLDHVSHVQNLAKLEELDLRNCKKIRILPDLSGMGSLRELYLSGCSNLRELPPSIEALNNLAVLELRNCSQLCELPRILRSLQSLNISGCTNILRRLDTRQVGITSIL